MKKLSILGSTGSIGVNTLEVVAEHPDKFTIVAMTAGANLSLFVEQIRRFAPRRVAVRKETDARQLRNILGTDAPEILFGVEGLSACAAHPESEMVVSAIVGVAGLRPTMAAIEAGKDIALANKETLVTAGSLFMDAISAAGVELFPVDSEHSAIFQSLRGHRDQDVRRLILTASGGPFREFSMDQLKMVRPAAALAHPNWDMGRKISIDSATMMNKGLEIIEARWLFALPGDQIAVHIHPQSVVHSMVEYVDGSVIAQLGIPDMKMPIAYALSWPERLPLDLPALDLCQYGSLTFQEPDCEKFACLQIAYDALAMGGTAPAVINAANEVAVDAFLAEQIPFLAIAEIIATVLARHGAQPLDSLETVFAADHEGREVARELIARRASETLC